VTCAQPERAPTPASSGGSDAPRWAVRLAAYSQLGQLAGAVNAPGTDVASRRLGARALLAEDNPVNQDVARRMLGLMGCDVDERLVQVAKEFAAVRRDLGAYLRRRPAPPGRHPEAPGRGAA
jgi:hypothetical protein